MSTRSSSRSYARITGVVAASLAVAMTFTACGSNQEGSSHSSSSSSVSASSSSTESSSTQAQSSSAKGEKEVPGCPDSALTLANFHDGMTVPTDADRVIATDNRVFRTLDEWGVKLVAAPKRIMAQDVSYKNNDEVVDLGNHKEPDLEQFTATDPQLVINGQRFQAQCAKIPEYAPDATILSTYWDQKDGQPLDDYLRQLTTSLGEIFNKQEEAEKLIADFDASIERAKTAYNSDQTVMGILTTGSKIGYAAPGSGRAVGPVFDILGLTPSLERDGSTNHEGDDISVEAIAQSNPEWLLVMDREAATKGGNGEEWTPAEEAIKSNEALSQVPAVKKDQIIYFPANMYLTEDIQAYTAIFNDFADKLEAAGK